jgi:hypothetical protein
MKLTHTLLVGEKDEGVSYLRGEDGSTFVYAQQDELTGKKTKISIPNKNAILEVDEVYNNVECVVLSHDKTSSIFAINIAKEIQDTTDLESWHYYKWLECPCNDDDERSELVYHSLKK